METVVLRAFYDWVRRAAAQPSFASVFQDLFHVFAIHTLRSQAADFVRVSIEGKRPFSSTYRTNLVETADGGSNLSMGNVHPA